jgi:3'-5' exoribonuclease
MYSENNNPVQPLLNAVFNLKRFMGKYFMTGLIAKIDRYNRPFWIIALSDSSADIIVECHNASLIKYKFFGQCSIHIEAVLSVSPEGLKFVCKNLVPLGSKDLLGPDLLSLPRSQCPFPEALDVLIILSNGIKHKGLKTFLNSVLLSQTTALRYLQCPASLNFHHNYSGGLLQHSVEVAWELLSLESFSQFEKDIALVAALLHDIGKTKTMTPDMTRTGLGTLVDHSCLALEICAAPLRELEKVSSSAAHQLRHAWTCYSPNARYGFKPHTNVAKQLQLIDGRNAKQLSSSAKEIIETSSRQITG